MDNPNPTVLEDEPESDQDVFAPDADGFYVTSRGRLASLFSASSRSPNWSCSLANPKIFYFPLLPSHATQRACHQQTDASGMATAESAVPPSLFREASEALAPAKADLLRSEQALRAISGNSGIHGSLYRRKQDVRRQVADYLSLLKTEKRVANLVEKSRDEENERRGRIRSSPREANLGELEGGEQGSRERKDEAERQRSADEKGEETRDGADALEEADRAVKKWMLKKRMRRRLWSREPFTVEELYNYIKHIQDPEHPYSLEQLDVVAPKRLTVSGSCELSDSSDQESVESDSDACDSRGHQSALPSCGPGRASAYIRSRWGGRRRRFPESGYASNSPLLSDLESNSSVSSLSSGESDLGSCDDIESFFFPVSDKEICLHAEQENEVPSSRGSGQDTRETRDNTQNVFPESGMHFSVPDLGACVGGREYQKPSLRSSFSSTVASPSCCSTSKANATLDASGGGDREETLGGGEEEICASRKRPSARGLPSVQREVRALELAYKSGRGRHCSVSVSFQPTIPHCSQATLIGLLILVKLLRSAPVWMKSEIRIADGKHVSFKTINRQLKDKERVSAAIENPALLKVINRGLLGTDAWIDITELLVLPE
ncbi:hypothetical protein TGCAST_306590 [Toxoplasma gondii CAST]|uniref:Uncharacterized protein n=1 Tax=Toxoplasma gondii CAST TaxID=943122 RepID=A0A425HPP0_TOXGO|nr:hypothetical protein TGCAST_306590 [Toxoplasma gondii CAST]